METELSKFVKRFIIGFIVCLIFFILFILVFYNKFYIKSTSIYDRLNKKNSFIIVLRDDKCSKCGSIEKKIGNYNISYVELKNSSVDYDGVLYKIGLSNSVNVPSVIYIKKGVMYSYIDDMSELDSYLSNLEE